MAKYDKLRKGDIVADLDCIIFGDRDPDENKYYLSSQPTIKEYSRGPATASDTM